MEIEFDPAKDAANVARRGISLCRAAEMVDVVERRDDRREYGEARYIALGFIDDRLYVCVYTLRGAVRRIISLRKANGREINAYRKTH